MNKIRRTALLAALGALLLLPGPGAGQTKPQALTLEECVIQAVKRNLGIAVQVLTYRQSGAAADQAAEKFIPSLSFDYTGQNQNSASFSWIQSADVLTTKSMVYSASLSQAVPFGGQFSIGLDADKYDSNTRFQTINPRYDGQLSFSFTQPLLKGFGWETSRKEILVARNSRDIAENDLKSTLLQTIYAVESAYWEYVYRIETLKVQRQSLALAEALLDKSRKEIAIGTLAPKEILSSQAEVASIKADILQGEMMVKDSADSLRGLINAPFDKDTAEIVPADTPGFVKREVALDEALAAALKNRPDLQSSALGIKSRELDYAYAKNQLLPQLDLRAQYWSPGLSGDRILFLEDNPLTGIVLGKVPGGASQALKDALGFKYNNWSVKLSLTIPLSSVFSRAAQAAAKAGLDQQIVLLKKAQQTAFLEIRAAVRAVQTNFERVGARQAARQLAEQKLEAEEAKLKVGLSNNFFVLNYQRDLALAKTAELRAMIDYTLSLGQLDKAMGISLDKRNIRVTDAAEEQR
jgi:outer membrane protein TolC